MNRKMAVIKSTLLFDSYFEKLDAWLFYRITGLPPRKSVLSEEEQKPRNDIVMEEIAGHLHTRQGAGNQAYIDIFNVVDQKASAMLTHISVMIAANALLLGIKTPPWLNIFSVILLVLFIFLALLSLRLLRFWTNHFPGADAGERPSADIENEITISFQEETFYFFWLYRFTLNVTTLLTTFSAVLMFVYMFFMDF